MKRQPSQLTRLIWDFYRENQGELQHLKLLGKCKVFRRWGVLHVCCWNREIANQAIAMVSLIEVPITKLRIAHKIKISVEQTQVAFISLGQGDRNPKMKAEEF